MIYFVSFIFKIDILNWFMRIAWKRRYRAFVVEISRLMVLYLRKLKGERKWRQDGPHVLAISFTFCALAPGLPFYYLLGFFFHKKRVKVHGKIFFTLLGTVSYYKPLAKKCRNIVRNVFWFCISDNLINFITIQDKNCKNCMPSLYLFINEL